jgi:pSer/pThr/pTyr-binding forkhead associated (FHA) protein
MSSHSETNSQPPPNLQAFLVVAGSQVVMIDKPVINLGRKKDNHIVIDNEHISRYHAQIRTIRGRYVIMDLNSTVGTSVNGKRIEQTFLKAGDVISLGGVPIIFGQADPNANINATPFGKVDHVDSGPTESTDIHSADKYLDYFNTTDDENPLENSK